MAGEPPDATLWIGVAVRADEAGVRSGAVKEREWTIGDDDLYDPVRVPVRVNRGEPPGVELGVPGVRDHWEELMLDEVGHCTRRQSIAEVVLPPGERKERGVVNPHRVAVKSHVPGVEHDEIGPIGVWILPQCVARVVFHAQVIEIAGCGGGVERPLDRAGIV